MGFPGLSIALLFAASVGDAHAETLDERVAEVRAAVRSRNTKDAKKLIKGIEELASTSEQVLSSTQIARLFFYQGAVEIVRERHAAAMDAWRKTLVIDNAFPFDREVLEDRDLHRLFEALRKEVTSRATLDPKIPENTGTAKIFLDGKALEPGEQVLKGQHLAQVVCPESGVQGQWTDFGDSLDWLGMCPEEIDTTVVSSSDDALADDFGGMAPVFGVADGAAAGASADPPPPEPEPAQPEPEPIEPVVTAKEEPTSEEPTDSDDEVVADDGVGENGSDTESSDEDQTEKESKPTGSKTGIDWSEISPGMYMMAGGGVLVVGGAVLNFAAVNPAWSKIESARSNTTNLSRSEADQLTKKFNTSRGITLAMLGSGIALTGVGVLFLDNTSLTPTLSPMGVGVGGAW